MLKLQGILMGQRFEFTCDQLFNKINRHENTKLCKEV